MPLIYGEGENAFIRLQEEIIGRYTDHSIFTHIGNTFLGFPSLLASSPDDFSSFSVVPVSSSTLHVTDILESHQLNRMGLRINAACVKKIIPSSNADHVECDFIVLNCRYLGDYSGYLGLRVKRHLTDTTNIWVVTGDCLTRIEIITPESAEAVNPEWHLILRGAMDNLSCSDEIFTPIPHVWLRTNIPYDEGKYGYHTRVFPPQCWIGPNEFDPGITKSDLPSLGFKIIQKIYSGRHRRQLAIVFRLCLAREKLFHFQIAFCLVALQDPELQMQSAQACLVKLEGDVHECSWTSQDGDVFCAKADEGKRFDQELFTIDITRTKSASSGRKRKFAYAVT